MDAERPHPRGRSNQTPVIHVTSPTISVWWRELRTLEPKAKRSFSFGAGVCLENMSKHFHNHIGTRLHWGIERPFTLSADARHQHLYTIGKSGSGKSTFLKSLITQDIYAGRGVALIDPHGDLAEEIFSYIPPSRSEDVIYFNPAERDHPVAFNVLHSVPEHLRPLVASGVVGAFKNIWIDSWGPRLEYILYASVAALLDCENTSLLGVPRMLSDSDYRRWVVRQIRDPIVRGFWENEFESYDRHFLIQAISPIQNKVNQLFMAAPLRNVLAQVNTKIDPRQVMDEGKIFIANLSKGRIGEDKTRLLGSLLSTWFATVAMSRCDTLEELRNPFYLFIDEFQNFATGSFASILSEARKYRLSLTLSHQYIGQLTRELRDAVFGNAGTIVSFQIGETDAEIVAREYGFASGAGGSLTTLSRGDVYVKTHRDGEAIEPFLARVDLPHMPRYSRRDKLARRSHEKYATPLPIVEGRIERWLER